MSVNAEINGSALTYDGEAFILLGFIAQKNKGGTIRYLVLNNSANNQSVDNYILNCI